MRWRSSATRDKRCRSSRSSSGRSSGRDSSSRSTYRRPGRTEPPRSRSCTCSRRRSDRLRSPCRKRTRRIGVSRRRTSGWALRSRSPRHSPTDTVRSRHRNTDRRGNRRALRIPAARRLRRCRPTRRCLRLPPTRPPRCFRRWRRAHRSRQCRPPRQSLRRRQWRRRLMPLRPQTRPNRSSCRRPGKTRPGPGRAGSRTEASWICKGETAATQHRTRIASFAEAPARRYPRPRGPEGSQDWRENFRQKLASIGGRRVQRA
jgi:hypothetical protein